MAPRGRRSAARAARESIRTSTPAQYFDDEEEVVSQNGDVDMNGDTAMDDGTPEVEDNASQDQDDEEEEGIVDVATPVRRGRGGYRGRRGRGRGRGGGADRQVSSRLMVRISKDGEEGEVIDDEVVLPEDPDGERKVDKNGVLLGGRDYRVRVFKIPTRGNRLYMLSTEPARCTGFRDSYLFFNKHMHLHKVVLEDSEKFALIDASIIPHSYKGRTIGVVTARSVFREFGARIVVGGKKITDDYYVQKAKERGDVEGELADPTDQLPPPGQAYNKNQYVAWHGASAVYHTSGPAAGVAQGPAAKKKTVVTGTNWMLEHAKKATEFNRSITARTREAHLGLFDAHTNLFLMPSVTLDSEWDPKAIAARQRLLQEGT